MAPVLKRLTISVAGSTSSSGTGRAFLEASAGRGCVNEPTFLPRAPGRCTACTSCSCPRAPRAAAQARSRGCTGDARRGDATCTGRRGRARVEQVQAHAGTRVVAATRLLGDDARGPTPSMRVGGPGEVAVDEVLLETDGLEDLGAAGSSAGCVMPILVMTLSRPLPTALL